MYDYNIEIVIRNHVILCKLLVFGILETINLVVYSNHIIAYKTKKKMLILVLITQEGLICC